MKKTLVTCFIDFKKAFDSVWRDALMLKLINYGIGGNFFLTVEDMYRNGYALIKTKGLLSEAVPSEVGVRQGDILSPNLFNLFINDLPECLSDSADCPQLGNRLIKCLLYVDMAKSFKLFRICIKMLNHALKTVTKYLIFSLVIWESVREKTYPLYSLRYT